MGFGQMAGQTNANANAMQNLSQFMLQNLQQLIAANPNFLTGGIPNKLLSQMWVEPTKVMQSLNVSIMMEPQRRYFTNHSSSRV